MKKFLNKVALLTYFLFPLKEAHPQQNLKHSIEMRELTTSYSNKAWYAIEIGNIPIGLMQVSVQQVSSGYPSEYMLEFASRVGTSPYLTVIKGQLNNTDKNRIQLSQRVKFINETGIFQNSENKWEERDNKLSIIADKGATLQALLPIRLNHIQNIDNTNANIFYINPNSTSKNAYTLLPFIGSYISNSNLDLKYDNDHFLNFGALPINENAYLNFKRINENEIANYQSIIPNTLIDYGWITGLEQPKKELDKLANTLNKCIERSNYLNKIVIKTIPQSSYLSYRKLINISHYCSNTNNILKKTTGSFQEKLLAIASETKKILKEDKLELPYSLINSPDTTVFYNNTLSFLWPIVSSQIIQNSIEEISTNFEFEKNRKSLLGVQVSISSLQPRSVVRADIKLIDPALTFIYERSFPKEMKSDSLTTIDKPQNGLFSSYLINGQYYAKNQNIDLETFCSENKGKIGIDLGDAPQTLINTEGLRGMWDIYTRIKVGRTFAMKAASTKSCHSLIFRTTENIANALKNDIEDFKNSVLGSDNEILLSNNIPKKLLVMPGKYRMTTTSLISGSVIAAHEFSVEAGSNTMVTAKAN